MFLLFKPRDGYLETSLGFSI